jgi:uncharacterized protein (DUF58 family)
VNVLMLTPRSTLLFLVAVVVLPAALLAGMFPSALAPALLTIVVVAVIAAADAVWAPARLAGIDVQVAPVVRLSKDREGRIELLIRNNGARAAVLRLAPDLPLEMRAHNEEIAFAVPPKSDWSRLPWTCSPARRGRYPLETVYLGGSSALGLWLVRKELAVKCEIRVYPNLATERKSLAALFLKRGSLGLHVQRQLGKGRDFEKLREYAPGDSFDDIYWKATARRARPVTKVFQIERTQEVYVIVDTSRLSQRASGSDAGTMLERYVTAALVLGLAAEQQGDLFGLITFSDRVEAFVPARNGKNHYGLCRDVLYTVQPKNTTPDLDELSSFIRLRLRRRALVIFLTSLDDPALADSFLRNVELLRRHHVVMVNMIRQASTAVMFSNPDVHSTDELYQQLGGHLRWQRLAQLEKALQRRGVRFALLENERFSADAVSGYLTVKRRQLL